MAFFATRWAEQKQVCAFLQPDITGGKRRRPTARSKSIGRSPTRLPEADNGLLTTARDVDGAIAELMLTGGNFWVSNISDPGMRDTFVAEAYARDRLTVAVQISTCQSARSVQA